MGDIIELKKIVRYVKDYLDNQLERYSDNCYRKDVVLDNDICYRVIIECGDRIAELLVEKPGFAPYRYVSFNVLACVNNEIKNQYCWYDCEDSSIVDIENGIADGLKTLFGLR